MGADARITLPSDVRVKDVATVIGVLAGLKPHMAPLPSGGTFVTVGGVAVQTTSVPEMIEIVLKGDMVDHMLYHSVYFHFETDGPDGQLLSPSSTPFWVALGKRLVDFFGGTIDYNDSDLESVNYVGAKPRVRNNPTENAEWQDFQNAMADVAPLTTKEIRKMAEHAAYK